MGKQEGGLYALLEQRLKEAKEPLTAVDLWEDLRVQQLAQSINRVSDYLANLYRKGRATRCAAPRRDNSAVRFAYVYHERKSTPATWPMGQVTPEEPATLVARPNLTITEHQGAVTIELPQFVLTVKTR